MWDASDEALLAGMAAGDADAALAFVRRFQRRVYGLARMIVTDDAHAEDVAQEAFVRAWRSAATYDARRGSVTTWLLTITRNLAIDSRRLRRPDAIDPSTLAGVVLAASPDPADVAATDDGLRRVATCLARLPDTQRRAVVRAVYLGQTAREVSEEEHIPIGTAKTRIRSALLAIRAAVDPSVAEIDR